MFGVKDPVIREVKWLDGGGDREVTAATFWSVMQYAEHLRARVYEWTGKDRNGAPLVVVWWAGKRAGQLWALYEISERGE